ncbi:MAG: hypothetical protein ACI9O6_001476 [Glaciecola sp.]|jgi:hypothetical protein
MREEIKMESDPYFHNTNNGLSHLSEELDTSIVPFFSVRKLRLIYNELHWSSDFEYHTFDAFEHQVMSSATPQLELNKWQAISSRR